MLPRFPYKFLRTTHAPQVLSDGVAAEPLLSAKALKTSLCCEEDELWQGEVAHGVGFVEGVQFAATGVLSKHGVVHVYPIVVGVDGGFRDAGDGKLRVGRRMMRTSG